MLLTLFYNITQFLLGSKISAVNIINISFIIAGLLYGIIYYKFKDIEYFTSYIANINNVVMFIGADVTAFAVSKYFWTKLHASSQMSQSSMIDALQNVELSQDQKPDSPDAENIICDAETGLCMRVDKGFDMKKANSLANEIVNNIANPDTDTSTTEVPTSTILLDASNLDQPATTPVENSTNITDPSLA